MTTTTQRSQRPLKMNQIHPRQKLKQHAFFGRENHNVYRDENSTRSSHLFHEMEAYWLIEMHHRSMSTSYDRHEKRRSKLAVHSFLHPTNATTQRPPVKWIPLAGVELTTVNRDVSSVALAILSSLSDQQQQPDRRFCVLRRWRWDRYGWLNGILKTISQRRLLDRCFCYFDDRWMID